MRSTRAVARALGAELVVTVRWRGENVDRVLDEDHARLVGRVAELLGAAGWLAAAEVTYAHVGERGSIDLLAFHRRTGTLLVVEVAPIAECLPRTFSAQTMEPSIGGGGMSERNRARGITLAGAVAGLRRGVAALLLSIVLVSLAGLLLSLTR